MTWKVLQDALQILRQEGKRRALIRLQIIDMSSLVWLSFISGLLNIAFLVSEGVEASDGEELRSHLLEHAGRSMSEATASEEPKGNEHPECPGPTNHTVKEHVFMRSVSNCTCACADGKEGWYKNGTPCLTLALGYNKENTTKDGKCVQGRCVLIEIPFGCNGTRYDHLRNSTTDKDGNPMVGCAFRCKVPDEKNTTFREEFGFHDVGTACRHVKDPGEYSDTPVKEWVNAVYVNGSCTRKDNETLCIPIDASTPVC